MADELDRTAVEDVRDKLLDVIKTHYLARGVDRNRLFEVLNGLGIAVATVLGATAPDEKHTRAFFDEVIDQHLPACIAAAAEVHVHDGGTSAH